MRGRGVEWNAYTPTTAHVKAHAKMTVVPLYLVVVGGGASTSSRGGDCGGRRHVGDR